jgi:hypothetical protein
MTIDIDDLVAKISTGIYGDDRMTWSTIEAATTALSQLVAEVEWLREERPSVVAHLRERATHGSGNTITVEDACTILADLFERGEHRREEK